MQLAMAVLRKWRKLGLSHAPRTILSMTMALPLLPADMFDEALVIIQAEADLLSREHPNFLQFMSYLRLTWLNMASKVSTYGCPIRTNNIVESFHNIATQKLGTRNINVWTFLEKLKKLIADQELDFGRLKNGIQPRRARNRKNRERNTKITNAQKSLIEKRLPLKQFLLMFGTNCNIFQIEQLASFDDEALSNDVQVADRTLFADDFNVPIQTERIIRRRSRHRNIISLSHSRVNDTNSEASIDKDSEPEFNDVTAPTQETIPTGQNETSETVSNMPPLNALNDTQDVASMYEVPDDDYGYLNLDDSNASEELPFHPVNWDLQNSPNVSREFQTSEDICTLCFTNERTHIFVPCGHLACCAECIQRLERNRCPVCNTAYENYIRVRKP